MRKAATTSADPACDTESQSDLPREASASEPASIGDSITLSCNGDRTKVTVLDVIDPAVVGSPGIKEMFARLERFRDRGGAAQSAVAQRSDAGRRHVGVKLRMRNLEDASREGIVHTMRGGVLIDTDGREHESTGDVLADHGVPRAPMRGEPPVVVCDAFVLPVDAVPARYRFAPGDGAAAPAGEWRLQRTRPPVPSFGAGEQRRLLSQGVEAWNAWRRANPKVEVQLASASLAGLDLREADLSRADLTRADFSRSNLERATLAGAMARSAVFANARLTGADFSCCDLTDASFSEAHAQRAQFAKATLDRATLTNLQAYGAKFNGADLRRVRAMEASLMDCDFSGALLAEANLRGALLDGAQMSGLEFAATDLAGAFLRGAVMKGSSLRGVSACGANLQNADLSGATITGSDLSLASLVNACLDAATVVDSRVFGISAWNIQGVPARQDELVITPTGQAQVAVDDLEVANFVYLMLNNDKIRNAIQTVGSKGVLILGRFTERKPVLEAIKHELARLGLLPIVFDFERPVDRDFTETVMTLAGMSRFIVADITAPKSVPLELQATVPNYMVPLVPLLQQGEKPFSMFEDLWKKHRDWVLEPLIYQSVDQLVRVFKKAVVDPADECLARLRRRKAERMVGRSAADYDDPQ